MIKTKEIKKVEQTKNNNVKYDEISRVITYSSKELEERRKDDWKESKQNINRLYPRWRKGD